MRMLLILGFKQLENNSVSLFLYLLLSPPVCLCLKTKDAIISPFHPSPIPSSALLFPSHPLSHWFPLALRAEETGCASRLHISLAKCRGDMFSRKDEDFQLWLEIKCVSLPVYLCSIFFLICSVADTVFCLCIIDLTLEHREECFHGSFD